MEYTLTRRDSITSIDSASSVESAEPYLLINPETRILNEAIEEWRDYHGNGRTAIADRLLEILMELTQMRAQMNEAEVEAFRRYPDFVLMEAILHHSLLYTWGEGPLPLLCQREVSSTSYDLFNFSQKIVIQQILLCRSHFLILVTYV